MRTCVVLVLIWLALAMCGQAGAGGTALARSISFAPLFLVTNGPGRVLPFHDGQMLLVGAGYRLTAIPDRGYAFAGWQRLDVFVDIVHVDDGSGNVSVLTNTAVSPVPVSDHSRSIEFTVQAPEVIVYVPGVRMLTRSEGLQADFVRVDKSGNVEGVQ